MCVAVTGVVPIEVARRPPVESARGLRTSESNAMAVTLLNCPNCGAPLPASVVGAVVVCEYCKRSVMGAGSSPMRQPTPMRALTPVGAPSAMVPHPPPPPVPLSPRFVWSDEHIIALAQEFLGVGDDRFFAPNIPPDKEATAREEHKATLSRGQRILVLYDDTLFGNADDGFILTSSHFCWENLMEDPQSRTWRQLNPERIEAQEDGVALGNGAQVSVTIAGDKPAFIGGLVALLRALATHARSSP